MPFPSVQSSAQRVRRVQITIPASSSTAVTIQSLVEAALEAVEVGWTSKNRKYIMGGSLSGNAAAYTVGDAAGSLPQTIAIGATYSEPSLDFLSATYVKAAADATTTAVVSVYLAGYDR